MLVKLDGKTFVCSWFYSGREAALGWIFNTHEYGIDIQYMVIVEKGNTDHHTLHRIWAIASVNWHYIQTRDKEDRHDTMVPHNQEPSQQFSDNEKVWWERLSTKKQSTTKMRFSNSQAKVQRNPGTTSWNHTTRKFKWVISTDRSSTSKKTQWRKCVLSRPLFKVVNNITRCVLIIQPWNYVQVFTGIYP